MHISTTSGAAAQNQAALELVIELAVLECPVLCGRIVGELSNSTGAAL